MPKIIFYKGCGPPNAYEQIFFLFFSVESAKEKERISCCPLVF
jgi:hypothetical protein